jgi:hypothetical protein
MPNWKPAKKDGEPVPIAYICPVVFTIKDWSMADITNRSQ